MEIINKTKNTVLAHDALVADNPFNRLKGLLGKKEFNKGSALIIRPCNSIHTFFMRFAIDVAFLDSNNKVVKAISNIMPFRISGIYLRAHSAVELPAGTLQDTATQAGDCISLKP